MTTNTHIAARLSTAANNILAGKAGLEDSNACIDAANALEATPALDAPATSAKPEQQAGGVPAGESAWRPIATAPRDGANILLRWGIDGVSQAKYVPGLTHPWKFIDTNDGITWLVNHCVDGLGGPSHWMPMPDENALAAAPSQSAVQPLSNAQFVKCIKTAGFKTWDSRMWSLKREIEASHGIVTKESGNGIS